MALKTVPSRPPALHPHQLQQVAAGALAPLPPARLLPARSLQGTTAACGSMLPESWVRVWCVVGCWSVPGCSSLLAAFHTHQIECTVLNLVALILALHSTVGFAC